MLIDVTDGDTIKQVQLEEQIDDLMLRITELENKNKMLTSEKLLMFVENKELKAEIETLKHKNVILKIANKFLKSREQIIWKIEKERYDSLKELNLKKQLEKEENDMHSNNIKWIIAVLFLLTFVLIVISG